MKSSKIASALPEEGASGGSGTSWKRFPTPSRTFWYASRNYANAILLTFYLNNFRRRRVGILKALGLKPPEAKSPVNSAKGGFKSW